MDLLVSILILLVIFAVAWWVVGLVLACFPTAPQPLKNVVIAILGIIFLIWVISLLSGYAPVFPVLHRGYR